MSAALSLPSAAPRPPVLASGDAAWQGRAMFLLSLRARGVFDTNVLRAMELVPRDLFAPRRFADLARSEVALPLACGQTMTGPASVAAMLVALDVRPGQRVLEVGTGSGYVAALLARMGAEVVSVERHAILADSAALRLTAAGLAEAVTVVVGDGLAAGAGDERFDRILLNGSVFAMPPALTSRLSVGGRAVGALASGLGPVLATVTRKPDGALATQRGTVLRIAPLVEARNPKAAGPSETEA